MSTGNGWAGCHRVGARLWSTCKTSDKFNANRVRTPPMGWGIWTTFHTKSMTKRYANSRCHGPTTNFDLHPDGKRIVVLKAPNGIDTAHINKATFFFNFFDELRRKAPVG